MRARWLLLVLLVLLVALVVLGGCHGANFVLSFLPCQDHTDCLAGEVCLSGVCEGVDLGDGDGDGDLDGGTGDGDGDGDLGDGDGDGDGDPGDGDGDGDGDPLAILSFELWGQPEPGGTYAPGVVDDKGGTIGEVTVNVVEYGEKIGARWMTNLTDGVECSVEVDPVRGFGTPPSGPSVAELVPEDSPLEAIRSGPVVLRCETPGQPVATREVDLSVVCEGGQVVQDRTLTGPDVLVPVDDGYAEKRNTTCLRVQGNLTLLLADQAPTLVGEGDAGVTLDGGAAVDVAVGFVNGLAHVFEVGGALILRDSFALVRLGEMPNLPSIGGGLALIGNASLQDLTDFDRFTLQGAAAVGQLDPTEETTLLVWNNDALTSLDGIVLAEALAGSIVLVGNALLEDVAPSASGFLVTTTGGRLYVAGNPELGGLRMLQHLTSLDGQLFVNDNDQLPDLSSLEALHTIGGSLGPAVVGLDVKQNARLTRLGLPALTTLNGSILVDTNGNGPGLSGMTGFEMANPEGVRWDGSAVTVQNPPSNDPQPFCDEIAQWEVVEPSPTYGGLLDMACAF